jgi:hypothetical protein
MAFEVYVYMVASAPSLSKAIDAILTRLVPMDFLMEAPLAEIGGERRHALPYEPGWEAKVNTWPNVLFSVCKTGPLIGITLKKLSGTALRARVMVSGRLLQDLFLEKRQHDPIFYVPLFQIALALGVRAGVGDMEMDEFEPKSEKEVEEAIWRCPLDPKYPSRLGFLRRVPGTPKPAGDFVVTERPEGYWLLEHASLLRFLAG